MKIFRILANSKKSTKLPMELHFKKSKKSYSDFFLEKFSVFFILLFFCVFSIYSIIQSIIIPFIFRYQLNCKMNPPDDQRVYEFVQFNGFTFFKPFKNCPQIPDFLKRQDNEADKKKNRRQELPREEREVPLKPPVQQLEVSLRKEIKV